MSAPFSPRAASLSKTCSTTEFPHKSNYAAGESELDPILYDRIKVVRGATGLLTGAGQPSASVNLVRKRADSKTFKGEATISVGSWGNYRGTLDLSTPVTEDGRIRTRLVASHEDKKSFFDRYERKRSGKARAGPRPGNTNTAITSSSLMPGWSTASPRHTRSTPPTPASSTSRTSEIARGWQLFLGAMRFIAQDAAGKDINTERPRPLLRPFTAYQLPVDWHRLTIGGGVNWQSRAYYDGVGPNRESQEQGGHAITNLMARYQLSPDLSLQVNVNNVFDKKYQRAVNWHGQGIWGTPAEVMATLRYRF